MSTRELVIIADDLTSATDGTACFAANGWKTAVLRTGWDLKVDSEILSIDIDSRTETASVGSRRIIDLSSVLTAASAVVKQFDSTLRGHIASECRAALQASKRKALVVLAAFPTEGRTTVNGVQLLHGVPIEETELRFDPLNPVKISSLVSLFRPLFKSVVCVDGVAEARCAAQENDVVIVNAVAEEQLDQTVGAMFGDPNIVWAGSTGLLRSLSRTIFRSKHNHAPTLPRASNPLVIVGSRSNVSRQQLQRLAPADSVLVIDPSNCNVGAIADDIETQRIKPIALTTVDSTVDPNAATAVLASIAATLISRGVVDGLVTTGGETTKHILQAAGTTAIDVLTEIEPGIPYCLARSAQHAFPIVMKAGAFGSEQIFTKALELLRTARIDS